MEAKNFSGRWHTALVKPEDYSVFDRLFQESFHHQMTEVEWRWKYENHPGQALFAFHGPRAIAHYGCLTQRVLMLGEPVLALQPVDVLVSPSERGVLTRHGPMFLSATTLFENLFGPGRKHRIGMGFPTTRHLILAERLGLFESAGCLVELVWTPLATPLSRLLRVKEASEIPGSLLDRMIDRLWIRMAADLKNAVVLVRDSQRFRHRYLLHPTKQYRIMVIQSRFSLTPLGIMVIRMDEGRSEWVDFVAPLSSIPTLVRVGRYLATMMGAKDFHAWVAEGFAPYFKATGPTQKPTDVHNLTLTWVPTIEAARIKDRWWLMAGDTDFR